MKYNKQERIEKFLQELPNSQNQSSKSIRDMIIFLSGKKEARLVSILETMFETSKGKINTEIYDAMAIALSQLIKHEDKDVSNQSITLLVKISQWKMNNQDPKEYVSFIMLTGLYLNPIYKKMKNNGIDCSHMDDIINAYRDPSMGEMYVENNCDNVAEALFTKDIEEGKRIFKAITGKKAILVDK